MQPRTPRRPAPRTSAARRAGRCRVAGWLSIVALSLAGAAPVPAADPAPRPHVPGRLFVKLRGSIAAGKASPALRAALGPALDAARPLLRTSRRRAAPVGGGIDRLLEVRVPDTSDVPRLAAKLSHLPEVEYAEPVYVYDLADAPDDPYYTGGMQAYLANMQVTAAWDVRKSETGAPRPVVCIVDGGTHWGHEDLLANVWTNPGEIAANGLDDDANGFIDDLHGWDFRDNEPDPRGSPAIPSNRNHGTHTAGLAAAVTDNATGVAAASWNPLLMSVCASGTSDGSIAWGYSGIVYAAENGADVVSLSWGGSGGSLAEQDIIDFAISQGTTVVAAAGNGGTNTPFFPAAYRDVVAVANVTSADVRYGGPSGSNWGGWVDVAACGVSVWSTFDNGVDNYYGASTGTSMACPVAAGVAALIKAHNPGWSALEVAEQLRVTCDNINASNPGFVDQLGRGRVNALSALTLVGPAVRATSWTFQDAGADGQLNQGESAGMSLVLHNYHADAVNPSFTLSTTSPWISIVDGTQNAATIANDATVAVNDAFSFTVSPNVPPGTAAELRLDMAATGYSDFQYIVLALEPVVETHDINNVQVSLTATGGIGWVGFPGGFGLDGAGFTFQDGPNVLFEGALMLGTAANRLSDAARQSGEHTDFTPALHDAPTKSTPGLQSDQEIAGVFTDSTNVATPLGVRVRMSSWALASPPYDDFVLVGYDVHNRTAANLDSLWAGLFCDWDIDGEHYATNHTAYDAGRRLAYAWDAEPSLPYVGVLALSGTSAGFSAIPINGVGAPWSLANGFDKTEKWDVLQGGNGVASAGPTDIATALSTGPYTVPLGGHARVFFALVAGTSLADLQANADLAAAAFDSLTSDAPEVAPGARLPIVSLGPAVPNPFNPTTRLELEVRAARAVSVAVYDVRGQLVRTLLHGRRDPGRYSLTWDGRDDVGRRVASGAYFARLQSGDVLQVQRLVLAK